MGKRLRISGAELEVLKILWDEGPCTARHIRACAQRAGREWASTTILTLMSRLEEKGYVTVDRSEGVHRFEARVDREGLLSSSLDALVDDVCDGSVAPLVQALIKGQPFTKAEIREFREMLDGLPRRSRKRPR